jgi:hypothetical protein
VLALGALGAGAAYARKRSERIVGRKDVYSVLINRPLSELRDGPDGYAAPLDSLAEHARLELTPGAGGRGTTVRAEARDGSTDVREELREAKQVLETGQVLRPDAWPADRGPVARKATDLLDRRPLAKGGGR